MLLSSEEICISSYFSCAAQPFLEATLAPSAISFSYVNGFQAKSPFKPNFLEMSFLTSLYTLAKVVKNLQYLLTLPQEMLAFSYRLVATQL